MAGRTTWRPAALAGLMFGLAACGGTAPAAAPATPGSATPAASQPGLTRVNMVSHTLNPPTISNIYYFVARDEGVFAKNGLEVQFQNAPNGATDFALLKNNQVQFSSTSFDNIISGNAAGNSTKLVVGGNWNFPGMIVAGDKIKTVADLKGATVGLTTPGNFIQFLQEAYVKKNGVDPKSINWVTTGSMANVTQYLIGGKIDAGWIAADEAIRALAHPGLHVLATPEQLTDVYAVSGGVVQVTDDYAKAQPATVTSFVKALMDSNQAIWQDEAMFDQVANKELPGVYSEDQLKQIYQAYRPYFGINGGIVDAFFTRILTQWREQDPKDASKISSIDQVIDRSFVKKVLSGEGVIKGTQDDAGWYKG